MTHTDLIHMYYAAWVRDDLEAVVALCTEDLVAVNVPIGPVRGVEHYVKDGKPVSLPYMSRFKFRDGKIAEWRDYFDLQTVLRQLGLPKLQDVSAS